LTSQQWWQKSANPTVKMLSISSKAATLFLSSTHRGVEDHVPMERTFGPLPESTTFPCSLLGLLVWLQ
jgi:hypothetical protein